MFGSKKEEPELAFDISEFGKKERSEIERVKQMLEAAEVIKAVARQSRIMPGGSIITPNIIFATNKRLIIRDPTALGLRAGIESIPYSQINKVHLEKGAFTSELVMEIGQYDSDDNRQRVPAIPKKRAADILAIINEHIRSAQDSSRHDPPQQSQKDDDPLTILKKRYVEGEISKEEYEQIRKDLQE